MTTAARIEVAFWDNRSKQHDAVSDYPPYNRPTERAGIKGDIPAFNHIGRKDLVINFLDGAVFPENQKSSQVPQRFTLQIAPLDFPGKHRGQDGCMWADAARKTRAGR
jgi:hypothetical protein